MTVTARGRWPAAPAVLAGAALGAAFFFWIAGVRVLTPTETAWAMQLDWHWHFLGWHFFRHEPWHLPPGRMDGYLEPLGTAIGFTDSIPLAAFALKPFAPLLPPAFQYLGLWMLLCFALQGAFGVLLMRLWTSSLVQQLLGAACFVLAPTLLSRVGHPALCSHWLLLWALWLYLRAAGEPRAPLAQVTVLGLVAGLIHPYLAVMMLGLIAALALRLFLVHRASGLATIALCVGGVVAGWWLSGFFVVSGAQNLAAGGLSQFSMNVLGPITPSGWSALMPELPVAVDGQLWEGFQYLGLGLLLLIAAAIATRVLSSKPTPAAVVIWPVALVATCFAIYALSPHVTVGKTTILQIDSPLLDRLAFFRATGRFFWPTAYVVLAIALAAILTRLDRRRATALLCAVVLIQLVDVHPGHAFRRRVSRDPGFHAWRPVLSSPAWGRLLPNYSHVVLYPPTYCGAAPVDLASVGYLAGFYGLTLNSGLVARLDGARRTAACREIAEQLSGGEVDDSRIYLGRPGQLDRIMRAAQAQQPVVCGVIDNVAVCATARSYLPWRDAAHLE